MTPNEERDPHTLAKTWTYSMLWKCKKCSGDYHYPICDREVGDDDCPFCNNRYTKLGVNSLVDTHPDLAKEYSPNNDYSVERVNKNTITKAKWICPTCNGEYWYSIAEREVGDDSCPFCKNRKPLRGFNTLKAMNPPWLKEWSYQYNYLICDPDEVLPSYGEKVWFECNTCHHEYFMSPKDREMYEMRHKVACPYCKGLRRKKRYFF